MYRDFLKKNRLLKLEIYQQLGTTNSFSIDMNYLETKINVELPVIFRQIKFLNEDIKTLTGESMIQINAYQVSLAVGNYETFETIHQQLIHYYLSFSSAYSLCQIICNGEKRVTIQEAGNMLHMSLAHIYRALKEINEIAAPYKVFFKKDDHNKLRIYGSELSVRIFLYVFISQNIGNNKKRIIHNSPLLNQVSFLNNEKSRLSATNTFKLEILLTVFKNRLVHECFFELSDDEPLMEFDDYVVEQFGDYFDRCLLFDKRLRKNEFAYFTFFMFLFVPDFFDDTFVENYVQEFSDTSDFEKKLRWSVIYDWQSYLGITLTTTELKRYYLYTSFLFVASYRLGISAVETLPFSQYFSRDEIIVSPIRKDLKKIVSNELEIIHGSTDSLGDKLWQINFSRLFYLPTQKYLQKKIKIGFYFENQPIEKNFIIKKLGYIYGHAMMITDNFKEADIIITDNYHVDSEKPIVFVEEIFERQNFSLLLNKINQVIIEQFY